MKLANGIQLTDGSILDDAFLELKKKVMSMSGTVSSEENTDIENKISDIVKNLDELKTKVEGITIPDISGFVKSSDIEKEITDVKASIPSIEGLAKSEDVVTLTNTLNQLVSDLQSGKYNVSTNATGTVDNITSK